MKITLENFCMIKKAEIELNGITVITGDNDSGKSTVGKALFCICNSFYNINKEIRILKKRSIDIYINDRIIPETEEIRFSTPLGIFYNNEFYDDEDYETIKSWILNLNIDKITKDKFFNELDKIYNIPKEKATEGIISNYLENVFKMQINNFNLKNVNSIAKIKTQATEIEIKIKENKKISHNLKTSFPIQVVYIDNPNILNENTFINYNKYSTNDYLKELLRNKKYISLINDILLNDKISNAIDLIDKIAPTNIKSHRKFLKEEFINTDSKGNKLYASNLSTGLKVFAIIKMLLLNNALKENTLLILDEPEIHLHPDWQIILAEVIVLLQRDLNLNILLTTHSPYFLEAIDVYSKKHGIREKRKYYLTRKEEEGIVFDDMTEKTVNLFKKFGESLTNLEDEAHYQNTKENENDIYG